MVPCDLRSLVGFRTDRSADSGLSLSRRLEAWPFEGDSGGGSGGRGMGGGGGIGGRRVCGRCWSGGRDVSRRRWSGGGDVGC
jgi:hypothetical protein